MFLKYVCQNINKSDTIFYFNLQNYKKFKEKSFLMLIMQIINFDFY